MNAPADNSKSNSCSETGEAIDAARDRPLWMSIAYLAIYYLSFEAMGWVKIRSNTQIWPFKQHRFLDPLLGISRHNLSKDCH